jgi:uncharacterized membrane protein
MVLVSDGATTTGNALEAARLAAASGVQIDVVPLSRPAGRDETLLTNVDAPSRVQEGEAFTIDITVESTAATEVAFRILAGGSVVDEFVERLNPGVNNFSRTLRATEQAFARYMVQMTPLTGADTYYQNNQLAAFTEIAGPSRILLVADDGTLDEAGNPVPDESPQLQLALQATGLEVDRVTPAELPTSLAGLSDYASVVLVNVNAKNLSQRKMETLQSYVRDLGGGLVAVGGPQSYGMGGYFKTPLEEMLPVDIQIKDQERFPSVSIAIVIDRSGSMGVQEGGVSKIQLAAEGAVRVVELLNDFDEITVIPVDTRPDNPIGPASAAEREEIVAQIRQIGAGDGGIFVRTGLEAAGEALARSDHQVKHIILLADGADSEEKEGVPDLIQALTAQGITISTVSIGDGPDVEWLRQMAEFGDGRFHFTDKAANLPQIFTQETTSIQRTYLVEERFFPDLGSSGFARGHAIFRAMESTGTTRVPPLYGYVGTGAKATAQVILETHLGDPLLAAWEYGLGRAVAWTSDATGRWGTEWVRWRGFPTFWSNVVRWSISQGRESNVETAVSFTGEQAQLTVDAQASDGSYLNDLNMESNIVSPSGESTSLQLQQVAPGRYEGTFEPSDEGAYFIRVAGTTGDTEAVVGQTSGWVLGYSPEYAQFEANPQLLMAIAKASGGRELSALADGGDDNAVFEHNLPYTRATRPIWPWLIGLAVVLLPFDIAVRRLVITRRDVGRAWSVTFGRLQPQTSPVSDRSEQVARLFQAKRRAGTRRREEEIMDDATLPVEPPLIQATGEAQPPKPPPEPELLTSEDSDDSAESLASRLLERKRKKGSTGPDDG